MTGRILMVSTHGYVAAQPEYGRPDTGGQVAYVLELSKNLARLGYDVDILTRRFEDQPAVEHASDQVRVLRFPCGGPDFIPKEVLCDSIDAWIEAAYQHLKAQPARYAFVNSHYWDAGLAGQGLSQRLDIPHLHTPHSLGAWKRDNMDGDPAENDRKYNFPRRIRDEKLVYHECDALIATTPEQRDLLVDGEYSVAADKIAVIPPGYDDTRFFPVSPASGQMLKSEQGLEGPLVLALGRVAENKGYDLLLRAMPVVCRRMPEARLLLAIGSNQPDADEQRQLAELHALTHELGIQDRVLFRGYIADEDLADAYRMADVFALSSRYEPFGMTAVEAMACGTPVVATTEGGLWKLVRWGVEALYANPFDPESFGHALLTILQRTEVRDQLSRHGAEKARASFTWTGVAQQMLRLIEALPQRPLAETPAATSRDSDSCQTLGSLSVT